MASNGNKGKFSDRLKRMKLIRYAKKMKIKVDNKFNCYDIDYLSKRDVPGVGKINIISSNFFSKNFNDEVIDNSVDNVFSYKENRNDAVIFSKGIEDIDDILYYNKDEVVDNSYNNKKFKGGLSSNLKRKSIEVAGVGVAAVGAVAVNLLGGTSQKENPVKKVNYDKKNGNLINDNFSDVIDKDVDFGKNERSSFKRVFKAGNDFIVIDKISDSDIKNGDKKTYLASQIIKKVKREFEKKLNEIDVLESELYFLNEKNENELDLEKCREIRKEIEGVIEKINHIIEQYNIYQNNKFLVDMLDIDDASLGDNISDFKRLYEGADIKRRLVSDYELITKYQLLYDKLDNIKKDVNDVVLKNEDKIVDYEKRDRKYNKIINSIDVIDMFNDSCKNYIVDQNKYINNIMDKVGKISVDKIVNYKLRGFGNLVSGVFRNLKLFVMGSFSLSNIYYSTYMANVMTNNLRKSLYLEKISSTVYEVEDFQFELNDKINTLDYNYNNIDITLDNVKKLKKEFIEEYNYRLPGYDETLRKINEIEGMVYNNKEKLDIIREKLKRNKLINDHTLKKVKVLQEESKPIVERM